MDECPVDECPARSVVLSRRGFLHGASAAVLSAPLLAALPAVATARPLTVPGVAVHPRVEWAQGLVPTGPMEQEQPGDVRVLLVHHTAGPNAYGPGEVPALLRGVYSLHTGTKGWPDVAYNFFVDRYGGVWEGRTGSLDGPVKADATGGSQGYAQLCCFVGDHRTEAPTAEAQNAMTALLAGLADTYRIDTAPGASTTFVSRGSSRWPEGTSISTTTIAAHRDMSLTACPGDAAYPLVREAFPATVTALRAARTTRSPTTGPPAGASPTGAATSTGNPPAIDAAADRPDGGGSPGDWTPSGTPGAAGALAVGAVLALVLRRRERPPAKHRAAGRPADARPDDAVPS